MPYTVSITNQGQISIPIDLRRLYGLDKTKKALVYADSFAKKIIVEPINDFLSLGGSLKTNLKISSKKIRKNFEDYLARQAT